MRLSLFILLLWLLPGMGRAQTGQDTTYGEALRVVDAWLDAQRDFDRLPGLSVAIVKDQQVLFSKGYGQMDLKSGKPATAETIYSICSISKLFTSIAIMQLWEGGKLRLDDSISALLPTYKLRQQYPGSGPVTIRSLLTHSSGLPRESDHAYWSAPDFRFPSREEITTRLDSQQTLYPASRYFQYSNLGIALLGEVVSQVSGMPYEQYVEKNILEPLRLQDTRTALPDKAGRQQLATGYSALHRSGERQPQPYFNANGIRAAAGFSSTAEDLARFAAWQFRLLEKGGRELLKASTLQEMHRVQWLDPDWKLGWGLGFSVRNYNGQTLVGHGGSCPGYVSSLVMQPKDKIGIVVMVNGQGVNLGKYTNGIFDLLRRAQASPKKGKAAWEALAGRYDAYAWRGETLILPWGDRLLALGLPATNPASEMDLLQHVQGDVFRRVRSDGTLGEEVRFERGAEGKVTRLWWHQNFYNRIPEAGQSGK